MIQLHRFRTNVSECINCIEWHNEDFGVGTGVNDCDLAIVLIDYVWLYFVFALIFFGFKRRWKLCNVQCNLNKLQGQQTDTAKH